MRRQRAICFTAGLATSMQGAVGTDSAFAGVLHMAQTMPPRLIRATLDRRAKVTLTTAALEAPDLDVLSPPVASDGG